MPTGKLNCFCAIPVGLTADDVTFTEVKANLKVVLVGTVVTVTVPLNGLPTPSTTTTSPTAKPWAVDVVRVATLEVNALFVMANTF
ncbi:unannotated protein [freshwater metagenome]|uniref:Unannotated protein n=1 Tax=freshwater metagenome TaxID=449393 RepID=A0A6J7Q1X9_9ZZZZ